MIWGVSFALHEQAIVDPRSGRIMNADLGEYHIPVNADVPQLEVLFVPERDQHSNPLHAKGLGELGISGAGAAITNAIYNACGVRVRDYPLTLDKILPGLPDL
jgi:xanthine dehydrogenase YagR molybdenum-binding subunit